MNVKERREEVRKLYNRGVKPNKIANRFGIPVSTVERDIQFIKAHNKARERALSAEIEREIRSGTISDKVARRRMEVTRLYEEGKRSKEIAEKLKEPKDVVKKDIRRLIEEGILQKRRKASKRRKEKIDRRREQVARLYQEGKSTKEISEELGISYCTINNDIKQLVQDGILEKREKTERISKKRKEKIARRIEESEKKSKANKNNSSIYTQIRTLEEEGSGYLNSEEIVPEKVSQLEQASDTIKVETRDLERSENGHYNLIEMRKQVTSLYEEEGLTEQEISEKLGIPIRMVKRYIESLNNALVGTRRLEKGNKKAEANESTEKVRKEGKKERPKQKKRRKKQKQQQEEKEENPEESKGAIVEVSKENAVAERQEETLIEDREKETSEVKSVSSEAVQNHVNDGQDGKDTDIKSERTEVKREPSEELYYKMMLRKIREFIVKGDFRDTLDYIKMLKGEVNLTEKEQSDLEKLVMIIATKLRQKRRTKEEIAKIIGVDVNTVSKYIENVKRILSEKAKKAKAKTRETQEDGR